MQSYQKQKERSMQMLLKLATYLERELVANTVLTVNRKRAGCKNRFNWPQKEASQWQ